MSGSIKIVTPGKIVTVETEEDLTLGEALEAVGMAFDAEATYRTPNAVLTGAEATVRPGDVIAAARAESNG